MKRMTPADWGAPHRCGPFLPYRGREGCPVGTPLAKECAIIRIGPQQLAAAQLAQGLKARAAAPSMPLSPAADAEPPPATAGPSASAPIASVSAMVAAAAVAPLPTRATERARRGVDLLERLHRFALAGAVPPEALAELRDWAAECGAGDAALAEIELRILVELARRER